MDDAVHTGSYGLTIGAGPFAPNNHKAFVTRLRQIKPLGYTSITQSLLAAAKDFPVDKTARNIIVIITDGIEECNGDPCAVSQELQKKGIILKPFIIGIGSDDEKFRLTYSCAGRYYNAQSQEELQKVIGVIINQALNNTTAQINLLDIQGMPRETNVPITIYDAHTGEVVENVFHLKLSAQLNQVQHLTVLYVLHNLL